MKTIFKRATALLLSLLMVFSVCSTSFIAYATTNANSTISPDDLNKLIEEWLKQNDGTLDYVSLGASNTNGYGLDGYLPPEVYEDPLAATKANLNTYGYLRKPENAYPVKIAKALKANLHQLALSSMRTEEVLYLLGDEYDYVNDAYMQWRFTGGQKWFEIAEPGGIEELRKAYQDYLTEADVITIDLGWNNFGVFAFNNIKTILADGKYWQAPDENMGVAGVITDEDYNQIRASVLESLKNNMSTTGAFPEAKMELMLDTLVYATLGAIGHFDSIVEWIYDHNPDAQIVVINIQNLADDLVVEFEGSTLYLGNLYGELIDLVNLYRASESTYADKYAFADAGDVETFLDEIVVWDGDPTTLGGDTKDCFDMYDDSLYVRSIVEYLLVGQALSGVFAGFREFGAEYGLPVFTNDDKYTYEFALSRKPEQLLSLNLGALDLNNPAGDDSDVEEYGQALSKHLLNLRHFDEDVDSKTEGIQLGKNAYDYVFASLEAYLNQQLVDNNLAAEGAKNGLIAQKTSVEAQKADAEEKLATLKVQLEQATAAGATELIAEIKAGIAQYEAGIAEADKGLAQINEGLFLFQAIEEILPNAKDEFATKLEGVYNTYHNTLNYAYDVVATVVKYVAAINDIEVNADSLNGFNNVADQVMGVVFNDFVNGAMAKFNYELYANGLQDLPEGKTADDFAVPDYVLNESNYEDPALRAILVLAVRYELGSSFFAHPNVNGHEQIKNAVLKALAVESDADKFTDTKMELYMSVLQEKYPNLYAMLMGGNPLEGEDDLSIIVKMLKMTGIADQYGVDLDALEAQIRAELIKFRDSREKPGQAEEAEAACYELYKKLIALATAATATKYVPTENSHYLSLGDSTITGYGLTDYVDGQQNGWLQLISTAAHSVLAQKLFGDNWKNQFTNFCQGSLRADDLLLFLGGEVELDDYYYEEIAPNLDGNLDKVPDGDLAAVQKTFQDAVKNANVISVAIGGGNFLTFAGKYINRVVDTAKYGEPYELDWARIGVDDSDASMQELQDALDLFVPIVDALGLMDQYLPEGVEMENPAKFARALAEGLAYGYASYNLYYSQVLERIVELNPNAQVLVLGMFNPVDDWTMTTKIDGEETLVDIGGTVANLMEAANLQSLAFALQNKNVSYIDTSDAKTILEDQNPDKELGFNDYYNSSFQSNGKAVHASVGGHAYIADQMFAALNGVNTNDEVDAILLDLYNVLTDDYLRTDEKLEGIGKAYNYLKDSGELGKYPEVKIIEEIYKALSEKKLITDDHSLAIVINVFEKLLDRKLEPSELRAIVKYVYFTVFAIKQVRGPELDLGILTAGEKLDILETVLEVLDNNGYVDEDITGVSEILTLYNDVRDDEILDDAKIETLISKVVETYVENEVIEAEDIQGLATECVEEVFNDPDIPAEKKVELFNKVVETLNTTIGGGTEVIPGAPALPDLTIVNVLFEELEKDGLLTHDQASRLIAQILPLLISGNVDAGTLVDMVYDIVYEDGFSVEKTVKIVLVITTVLYEEDVIYDYTNPYYAQAMAAVLTDENIATSKVAVKAAIEAVKQALEYLNNSARGGVESDTTALKEALRAELEATLVTLEKIEALLENVAALETIKGDYEKAIALLLLTFEEDLYAHANNIAKIAIEAGIFAMPYIQLALETINHYAAIAAEYAQDAYDWCVANVQGFVADYYALANEMKALASKIDPALGEAVYDFMIEVPSDTIKILYLYGEEAVNKLIDDAVVAGKDIYGAIAYLAHVLQIHGKDIYDAVLNAVENDPAFKAIYDELKKVYAEIEKIEVNAPSELGGLGAAVYARLDELKAEAAKLAGMFYEAALVAIKASNPTAGEALDDAIDARNTVLNTIGTTSGAYGEFFVAHAAEMGGKLLLAFLANWNELYGVAYPVFEGIFWCIYDEVSDYVNDFIDEASDRINNAIDELNKVLADLKEQVKDASGEIADEINKKIDALNKKIDELKGILEDLKDNIIEAGKLINEIKNDVIDLIDTLKKTAYDEARQALPEIVEDLKDLGEFIGEVAGERFQVLQEKLGEAAVKFFTSLIKEGIALLPEIDQKLYAYFYNNPEEVIAFFNEYGDKIIELFKEYGDEALIVIFAALSIYGDDLAAYIMENPEEVLAGLSAWAEKYGDRVVAILQVYAEALGICDAVREEIADLEAEVAALKAKLNALNEQLKTAVGDAKAAIEAQIEVVKAQIAKLEAQIKATKEKLQKVIDSIYELNANLQKFVTDSVENAVKAVYDAIEKLNVAISELKEAVREETAAKLEQLLKDGKELTVELLKDLADLILETAVKYAPIIDEELYNYFYNNPEEVIAFFNEYGDKIIELCKKYGDEALIIIAAALYRYGDDLAAYIMENPEEVLAGLSAWADKYGDRVVAILQVYAEALGICDAVREEIADLEAEVAALKAKLNALNEQLKTAVGDAKAAIEAQIEVVKAQIAKLEAQIKATKEKLQKVIDSIYELNANLQKFVTDSVENAVKAVYDAIEKLNVAISELKEAVREETAAKLEQLLKDGKELTVELLKDLADLILETAVKYAPIIDEELYNYFYNNPEEVIAFFNEYGDEIIELCKKYGDEALIIIAAALYRYGDDLAAYIMENPEEVLAGLSAWADKYGDRVVAILQVYAEALGICDAVRNEIEDLKADLAALQAQLAVLNEQLKTAAGEVRDAIEAEIAKVQAEIARVQNQINTLIEKLQKVDDAIIALNKKLALFVTEAIDTATTAVIEAIANLNEALKDLMANVSDEVADKLNQLINTGIGLTKELIADLAKLAVDAVIKFAPELDEYLYNYFYNNPEEVIAFFNEYGKDIIDLCEKYGDKALAVVAIALAYFGPELAEYVINNPEDVLAGLSAWADKYGDRVVAILQVYAEALGICDAVRNEIEDLKADLAALQAQLAVLNEQLKTAVGEVRDAIEAEIARVQAEIAKVQAKIAELQQKLQNLVNAIYNLDDALKKFATEAIEFATAAVVTAIANLENAVKELLDSVSDDVADKLRDLIKTGVGLTIDLLADLAKLAVDAAIKFAPELDEYLYNYFYNNPEEVIAFFNEYGDEIIDLCKKYGDKALAVVAIALAYFGPDLAEYIINNPDEAFAGLCAWADKYGAKIIAILQVYAEALGLCDAVRGEVAELNNKLAALQAELMNQLNILQNELQAELDALYAQLENATEAAKVIILEKIKEIESKIELVQKYIAELQAKIAELQVKIAEINAKLQALIDALYNLDDALKALLETGVEAGVAAVQKALNEVANAVRDVIGVISDDIAAQIDKLLQKAKDYLNDAYHSAIIADYVINSNSNYVALGDNEEYAKLFAQYLKDTVAAENVGYNYKVNTALVQNGSKISTLPVIINENLGTIAAADLISIGYSFDKVAENTILMAIELLMDGKTSVPTDYDWATIVGAEAAAEIEKLVGEIYTDMLNEGLGITVSETTNGMFDHNVTIADIAIIAVQYFVYNVVEYAAYLPQAVNAISQINPDAIIMINSISNPISGAKVSFFGEEIVFGDYLDYVCDAMLVETAVLAAIYENVVFVPTTEIETTFTNRTISFNSSKDFIALAELLTALMENQAINTTPNGNAYACQKMTEALNITVEDGGLLGDVNGDGVVDYIDAILILRYEVGFVDPKFIAGVADVDRDGYIGYVDAIWVLKYEAGLEKEFPRIQIIKTI